MYIPTQSINKNSDSTSQCVWPLMPPLPVMSLVSYLQSAKQSSKYPSAAAAGTNEVWTQQQYFYQKTENLQVFYGRNRCLTEYFGCEIDKYVG